MPCVGDHQVTVPSSFAKFDLLGNLCASSNELKTLLSWSFVVRHSLLLLVAIRLLDGRCPSLFQVSRDVLIVALSP
jgi:hypothetical protein